MALGANAGAVLRGVVFQALRPVFGGIVCGITLAAGFSAILHRTLIFPGSMDLFYGVPFYDPLTFAGLIVFTACLATIASFAPARRALVVDPMVALRYE
jgi:ABC-type lipoprotein release transport system permease subunit